jgi:hypothetical protein
VTDLSGENVRTTADLAQVATPAHRSIMCAELGDLYAYLYVNGFPVALC